MSRLTDLIAKAKAKDPQLGADLEGEFRCCSSRPSFGLNFERHRPEAVRIAATPGAPGRQGARAAAAWLHRQGRPAALAGEGHPKMAKKTADLELLGAPKPSQSRHVLEDLVVVAEFRDTIYPGLVSTGRSRAAATSRGTRSSMARTTMC